MSFVAAGEHDLLIRIKNGYMARKTHVQGVIASKTKVAICDLLKKFGFIADYAIVEEGAKRFINVVLNDVVNPHQDIPKIKFFSTPSRRWYVGYSNIKPVAAGRGISILFTNKGVIDGYTAKKEKVGGELFAEIY